MTPAAISLLATLTGQPEARVREVEAAVVRALASDVAVTRLAGGRSQAVALMLTLAARESDLRREVEDCRVTGDRGRAYGLWQEHDARVCSAGLDGQAARAVAHLAACSRVEAGTVEAALSCYGGSKAEVSRRVVLWGRLR